MSAYLCSPEHIGEMAKYANSIWHARFDPEECALRFAEENLQSVCYRYRMNHTEAALDFLGLPLDVYLNKCIQYATDGIDRRISKQRMYGMIRGYIYQSCEHEEWDKSEVHFILSYMIQNIIGPDFQDGWTYTLGGAK